MEIREFLFDIINKQDAFKSFQITGSTVIVCSEAFLFFILIIKFIYCDNHICAYSKRGS